MAFKFVVLATLLAVAQAGLIATPHQHHVAIANPAVDAVAATHQNVVRSFGGTVSQYSKSVDTPYSSVHKEDTRISNNVYTPAIAKTLTYAAPAPTAAVYTHATAAAAPTVYTQHDVTPTVYHQEQYAAPAVYHQHEQSASAVYHQHEQPAPTALYTHAAPTTVAHVAPTVVKSVAAPVYQHAAPVYHHEQPLAATTTYNHGPAASTYTHNAPGVAAYGTSQTVHYSPAETVSHMSFDGFGTHWGF